MEYGLSRAEEDVELLMVTSQPLWSDATDLQKGVESDPYLQKIITDIKQGTLVKKGFSLHHGILFYFDRLVIPSGSPWISVLLEEFHSTSVGGHSGYYRTYRRLAEIFSWVGIQKQVQEFIRNCQVRQRHKYLAQSPAGLLQPLEIPNLIWEDLSMDYITSLPRSKGYDTIMVIVDRLSKYAHFLALKHLFTAKQVAEMFTKEVVRLHGVPKSIVSDRDPIFISHFW